MRRIVTVIVMVALVAGAFAAPVDAKKKRKKKAPAPVATKLFMHGNETLGEADLAANFGAAYLPMDTTAGDGEKSMFVVNYGGGPNTACAGNYLFPVWTGKLVGQVVGDVKVAFRSMSTPGKVDVRIWPDVAGQACNESYIEPSAHATIDLAANGMNEVTIPNVDFKATAILMVQITPVLPTEGGTPFLGRVFYDGGAESARIEFNCFPVAPATSCTG